VLLLSGGDQELIDQMLEVIIRYTVLDREIGGLSEDIIQSEKNLLRKTIEYMYRGKSISIILPIVPQVPVWPPHILVYQKLSEILNTLTNIDIYVHIVFLEKFLMAHTDRYSSRGSAEDTHKALMKALKIDVDKMISSGRMFFVTDSELIEKYQHERLSDTFNSIINSIDIIEFYEEYMNKDVKGFYKYFSSRSKGAPLIIDFVSLLSMIFYTIDECGGGIVIIGRDKEPIIKYLLNLSITRSEFIYESIKEKKTMYVLYLPEIRAFYNIREYEPSLPGSGDSLGVIMRKLSWCKDEEVCRRNEIETLIKLHILRDKELTKKYFSSENIDITKESKDVLIEKLVYFYYDTYKEMEKFLKFVPKRYEDNDKEIVDVLKKLCDELRLNILKIIYSNPEGLTISEIIERLKKLKPGEYKRSTIEYHLQQLKDFIIKEEDISLGANRYKPAYSEIIIRITGKQKGGQYNE